MSVILPTATYGRHIVGDLVNETFTLAGGNGDTFTCPGKSIQNVFITPTTAISVGATWAGSVITFVTAGAWAAQVTVQSRLG
jgi:hypothetical protein